MKREKYYIHAYKKSKTISIRWKGFNDHGAEIDTDLLSEDFDGKMTRADLLELKEVIDAFISKTSNLT